MKKADVILTLDGKIIKISANSLKAKEVFTEQKITLSKKFKMANILLWAFKRDLSICTKNGKLQSLLPLTVQKHYSHFLIR